MVRIHAGQPFDALTLAHGLRPAYRILKRANNFKRLRVEWLRANEVRRGADRRVPDLVKFPLPLADACAAADRFPAASVVYFLRLRSRQLYIGSTTNLRQRLKDHASGQACRTTMLDPSVALLRLEPFDSFSQARRREAQLKRWSRAKKEALIRSDLIGLQMLARSKEKG